MVFLRKSGKKIFTIILFLLLIVLMYFGIAKFYPAKKENNNTEAKTNEVTDKKKISFINPVLQIDKINIQAPIILNVDGDDKQKYFAALVGGVAQMKGTSLPGEDGNIVIFGHSSADKSYTGSFGKVFAKLDNLKIGDSLKIVEKDDPTIFQNYSLVTKKIIGAKDVSAVNNTAQNQLTLITCWSIGTDKKRLILIFQPI